jgi:periplasmic protein CpxP/Spy
MMNNRVIHTQLRSIAIGLGLLIGTSLLGAAAVFADPDSGPGPGPGQGPGPGMDSEPRIERLVDELGLTDAQQERVRGILENVRKEQERLQAESRKQIDAVLTDEQRAKRDAMQQKRLDLRVARMTKMLDLTQDQASKIKAVFEEQRKNPESARFQLRERIDKILTPEQRTRLAEGPMRHPGSDRRAPPAPPAGD